MRRSGRRRLSGAGLLKLETSPLLRRSPSSACLILCFSLGRRSHHPDHSAFFSFSLLVFIHFLHGSAVGEGERGSSVEPYFIFFILSVSFCSDRTPVGKPGLSLLPAAAFFQTSAQTLSTLLSFSLAASHSVLVPLLAVGFFSVRFFIFFPRVVHWNQTRAWRISRCLQQNNLIWGFPSSSLNRFLCAVMPPPPPPWLASRLHTQNVGLSSSSSRSSNVPQRANSKEKKGFRRSLEEN